LAFSQNIYFPFPLKHQQENAFLAMQRFVNQNSSKVFILNGFAGSGKTTLLGGFIKWLDTNKSIFVLLASPGRAAKVLSDKSNSKATTIHSHIYTFRDLDDDLEKMSSLQENLAVDDNGQIRLLFDLKIINSSSEKVYIVDEASIVSDIVDTGGSFARFGTGELLKDILAFDKNGKFLFVGDPCQLPPIGQDTSPALSKDYIEKKFKVNTTQIELTEILRQTSSNGIITASLLIRNLQKNNPVVKFASFPLKGVNGK